MVQYKRFTHSREMLTLKAMYHIDHENRSNGCRMYGVRKTEFLEIIFYQWLNRCLGFGHQRMLIIQLYRLRRAEIDVQGKQI